MNLCIKQKKNLESRKQAYDHPAIRGRINWEIGIDIYMLLYTE